MAPNDPLAAFDWSRNDFNKFDDGTIKINAEIPYLNTF